VEEEKTEKEMEICLILKIAFHDHVLVNDLDGNILAGGAVDGNLNLGESTFSDCPTKLVLPYAIGSKSHFLMGLKQQKRRSRDEYPIISTRASTVLHSLQVFLVSGVVYEYIIVENG
jgi:hypothetical protein